MKHGICITCGREGRIKAKGMCKTCYERQRLAQRPDDGVKAAHGVATGGDTEHLILLDFGQHVGLLEELKQQAQSECRPLDWQIIYMLRNQMEVHV